MIRSRTSRPFASMKITVGMPTTPYLSASARKASVDSVPSAFTATKRLAAACTRGSAQAILSSSLQAVHHSAQKSMMTGRPSALARASASGSEWLQVKAWAARARSRAAAAPVA